MKIIISETRRRTWQYYLRRKYTSNAGLEKLVERLIREAVSTEAQIELRELDDEIKLVKGKSMPIKKIGWSQD